MGFRITYTRLFRCLLRHDYYLNLGDGVFFNDLDPVANAADRAHLLDTFDVRNLLHIRPLGPTARSLAGHRMRLVIDREGFYVGIATDPATTGGRIPATTPSPDTTWHFALLPRDGSEWNNVTNQRMRPNVPALYYFSNRRPGWSTGAPTAPLSLAVPAPARQRRYYAAGEVVREGGTRYQALRDVATDATPVTDTAFWGVEAQVRGEATDADRALLPTRFDYTLTPESGVSPTSLTANLQRTDGTPAMPPLNLTLAPGRQSVHLDFSAVPPDWYDLIITTDTAYTTTHRTYLNDELYDPTSWGVVSIGTPATDPGLRLFEPDGRLRQDGAGTTTPPEFQLRIPNRRTYWRYVAHPTQTLPASAGFSLDLQNRLVATAPRSLTRWGSPVQIVGGNGPVALPSPQARALLPEADGRVYSDLYLGVLDL
ncbi:hypothetical protein GGR26_002587 [Lewinella marina]|uniref:Uncharacterized protein n=1 Tax=Neolewinella marina TaxID=438751 RepID=A0A2G0CB48_9BACT|nr:hypothetical protein [Neolewinella marina]NJB86810.1 hypothetical protein [Neolewinella marina]PHK97180.1 hypothetical protein CGL56_17210 [Neolewinella marina]